MSLSTICASKGLVRLQEGALKAEKSIDLLSVFSPRNFALEIARLAESYSPQASLHPDFHYGSRGSSEDELAWASTFLHGAEESLLQLGSDEAGDGWGVIVELLVDRIRELSLEAALVQHRGGAEVVPLSIRRFVFSQVELSEADVLAAKWTGEGYEEDEEPLLPLFPQILKMAEEHETPIRVVEAELVAKAAVGDDCLYLQKGLKTSAQEATRLWFHEVEGHLLPRLRAHDEAPPFMMGTPGCSEDEEGRAVLLEERVGALGLPRRYRLAARYRLARALREEGRCPRREAHSLIAEGGPLRLVLTELGRVLRGGGLAREIVYLPAYLRVRRALCEEPKLEGWMKRGRISLHGARQLAEL